jgi:hypothetical protein
MIAAWNLGGVVSRPSLPERMDTFRNGAPRLAGSTVEGLVAEAHAAEWNYVTYAEQLKSRPVLILEANDRNTEDNKAMTERLRKAGSTRVKEFYMDTDHTFSDHRIALQRALLLWLESVSGLKTK